MKNKNKNNTPFLRNKISTNLVLYAATLILLTSTLLPVSNPLLLQPVQADPIPMTFKTPTPAAAGYGAKLTFDAHGTNSSGDQKMNGTIQLQAAPRSNEKTLNGTISEGAFYNNTKGATFDLTAFMNGIVYTVHSGCSTSNGNDISLISHTSGEVDFYGPVECSSSSQGGGGNTTSSMTATTTATQDSDGDGDRDGLPDSSDRCASDSNPRCFKEDTTTQQPSSSSNRTGNQTG